MWLHVLTLVCILKGEYRLCVLTFVCILKEEDKRRLALERAEARDSQVQVVLKRISGDSTYTYVCVRHMMCAILTGYVQY